MQEPLFCGDKVTGKRKCHSVKQFHSSGGTRPITVPARPIIGNSGDGSFSHPINWLVLVNKTKQQPNYNTNKPVVFFCLALPDLIRRRRRCIVTAGRDYNGKTINDTRTMRWEMYYLDRSSACSTRFVDRLYATPGVKRLSACSGENMRRNVHGYTNYVDRSAGENNG